MLKELHAAEEKFMFHVQFFIRNLFQGKPSASSAKCKLDTKTQEFLKFIFDKDMFNSTLKEYDLGK